MKKLIKKWLGITELKERADYNEALAKSNKQEIDNMMQYYIRPLIEEDKVQLSRDIDQLSKINMLFNEIDRLKPVSDKPTPKKTPPKKAAKKTPPKKVTKK